jgi:protein-tyrosine kinase
MSRNYELLLRGERSNVFLASPAAGTVFPSPGERPIAQPSWPMPGDMFLGLVKQIFLRHLPQPPRMVIFTAIDHGNGCSEVAASVAKTLTANASRGVCLVEANFRSPALPRMLGATNEHGLTDALQEPASLKSFVRPTHSEKLWLLTSGPITADSPQRLTSVCMRALSGELRNEFDFVIVDAPPVSRYAEVIELGKLSDGVVLIIEAGSTHRQAARTAKQKLQSLGIPILGAVLNKRTFPIPQRIYDKL